MFQGLFKYVVFISVAFVTEKLLAILDFFLLHGPDFLPPSAQPYAVKKHILRR